MTNSCQGYSLYLIFFFITQMIMNIQNVKKNWRFKSLVVASSNMLVSFVFFFCFFYFVLSTVQNSTCKHSCISNAGFYQLHLNSSSYPHPLKSLLEVTKTGNIVEEKRKRRGQLGLFTYSSTEKKPMKSKSKVILLYRTLNVAADV